MIRNSFIFLERISSKLEKNIWQQGINDWNDFLNCNSIKGISKIKLEYHKRKIKEASGVLVNGNYNYFTRKLPQKEMWRLYQDVKDESCFLDIEVDEKGVIILVGISNYYETNFFVKGVNLEKNLIERELSKYQAIITFNGGAFDLPKLKRFGIEFNMVHIDLKPLCVNMDLVGGLKEIEKELDLRRPMNLYGNPIELWRAFHASGDKEYLDLLIEYNREDCENLRGIMEFVWKKMSKKLYKQKE
jgi:uncharacterized protein